MFTPTPAEVIQDIATHLGIHLEEAKATRPHRAYVATHPEREDLHIYLDYNDRTISLGIGDQNTGGKFDTNTYLLDEPEAVKTALLEWKATATISTYPHWAYQRCDVTHLYRIGQRLEAEGLIKSHEGSNENYTYANNKGVNLQLFIGKGESLISTATVDNNGLVLYRGLINNNYYRANLLVRTWADNYDIFERGIESYLCQEVDFYHIGRIHTREDITTRIDDETGEIVMESPSRATMRINRYTSPQMGSIYGFRWVTHDKKATHGHEIFIPSDKKEKIHTTVWEWMDGKEEGK